MPHLCRVSLRLISPPESSPGTRGCRNFLGLEGNGTPFMGRGKLSRTPTNLQDLLRWFCSAGMLQSGGPDFVSSVSQLNLCAPVQNEKWCGEENCDQGSEWDQGALGFWHWARVRDPAIALELQIGVGVGWLGAQGAGAALGVNLRKLDAWLHRLPLHPSQKHQLGRLVNFVKNKTRPAPAYTVGFAPTGVTCPRALRKGPPHQDTGVCIRCCGEARAPGSPLVSPFP